LESLRDLDSSDSADNCLSLNGLFVTVFPSINFVKYKTKQFVRNFRLLTSPLSESFMQVMHSLINTPASWKRHRITKLSDAASLAYSACSAHVKSLTMVRDDGSICIASNTVQRCRSKGISIITAALRGYQLCGSAHGMTQVVSISKKIVKSIVFCNNLEFTEGSLESWL